MAKVVSESRRTILARYRIEERTKFTHRWFLRKYHKLKARAKVRGKVFGLSLGDYVELRKAEECWYCGTRDAVFTVDRRNNAIGYLKANCVLACYECNDMKGSVFTEGEMLILGRAMKKVHRLRLASSHV